MDNFFECPQRVVEVEVLSLTNWHTPKHNFKKIFMLFYSTYTSKHTLWTCVSGHKSAVFSKSRFDSSDVISLPLKISDWTLHVYETACRIIVVCCGYLVNSRAVEQYMNRHAWLYTCNLIPVEKCSQLCWWHSFDVHVCRLRWLWVWVWGFSLKCPSSCECTRHQETQLSTCQPNLSTWYLYK